MILFRFLINIDGDSSFTKIVIKNQQNNCTCIIIYRERVMVI